MANKIDVWDMKPNGTFIATLNDKTHAVASYPDTHFCNADERKANAFICKKGN